MTEQQKKLEDRLRVLTKHDVCVAFSGGVDSSLLLKMAVRMADENHTKVYAVTVSTRLLPQGEAKSAAEVARECGAEHHVLVIDEGRDERIRENEKERCYWCKSFFFRALKNWAEGYGVPVIMEGSNADDLNAYRPGLRAVKELGVLSPLAELGITKSEVRRMAQEYGLSVAEKPAAPCMATRFPYGTPLDFQVMNDLAKGEAFLQEMGFDVVRIRLHGDIARIEVAQDRLHDALSRRSEIVAMMRELGFHYITLDMEGFRSGSMDLW